MSLNRYLDRLQKEEKEYGFVVRLKKHIPLQPRPRVFQSADTIIAEFSSFRPARPYMFMHTMHCSIYAIEVFANIYRTCNTTIKKAPFHNVPAIHFICYAPSYTIKAHHHTTILVTGI